METAVEYRHVPSGTLAVLAQRLGTVCASCAYQRLDRRRENRSDAGSRSPKRPFRTSNAKCVMARD